MLIWVDEGCQKIRLEIQGPRKRAYEYLYTNLQCLNRTSPMLNMFLNNVDMQIPSPL